MEKKERPKHCFIGFDYDEEKCKDVRCNFREFCKRARKPSKLLV